MREEVNSSAFKGLCHDAALPPSFALLDILLLIIQRIGLGISDSSIRASSYLSDIPPT